jgi:cysteine desulfurase / selenocysteine lyase
MKPVRRRIGGVFLPNAARAPVRTITTTLRPSYATNMVHPEIIQSEFPALSSRAHLNAGALSVAPQRAIQSVQRLIEIVSAKVDASGAQIWGEFRAMCEGARRGAAWLVNAEEDEIALIESTTRGLTIAADAIPLKPGDRVLICDLEYPAVAIPWIQKQRTLGIEIDVIANRGGEVRIEDFAEKITPRARVVTVSSVQWTNGFRCDLAALSQLCRERNLFLVVDAIQQLGAIPLDVKATPVDFIACGGHKWLNAPFGMGFLYVNRQTMPRLNPPTSGLLSAVPPEGGWGAYLESPEASAIREYSFLDNAQRYEIGGTTNFAGAAALGASLSLTRELGKAAIAEHVHTLADYLIAELNGAGIRLVTNFEREKRAGIVTFDIGSAERNRQLTKRLEQNHVLVSVRYSAGVGGVRVCCHFYNSLADIDKLMGVARHP